jgi:glycosyltransferase involved in cell wall biosynthesis
LARQLSLFLRREKVMSGPQIQRPIKILLLARSLDRGGSERQLVQLALALDKRVFEVTVLTLYAGGGLEKELEGTAVRYVSLGKRGRWDLLGFFIRLARQLWLLRPCVIHGYLDIANLLALLAKPFPRGPSIIWGARASKRDLSHYDWLRRLAYELERRLSRFADRIIVNSEAGRAHLVQRGFPPEKLVLVQNGIDTDYFRPDREAGAKVRREWSIAPGEILIGIVGRLDPVKDHRTFLRAAATLSEERPHVRFVCVGSVGGERYALELRELASELSLDERIYWAGMRSDMRGVYNALDICVSSSESEGFSNAIAEAMACGVPCVVTDVGDSVKIVGDTGFVTPPLDPTALAQTLIRCLESDRHALGARARLRIEQNWSVKLLAAKTERVVMALCGK